MTITTPTVLLLILLFSPSYLSLTPIDPDSLHSDTGVGEWKGEMSNGEGLVSTWSVELKMIAIITRNLCKTTEASWGPILKNSDPSFFILLGPILEIDECIPLIDH